VHRTLLIALTAVFASSVVATPVSAAKGPPPPGQIGKGPRPGDGNGGGKKTTTVCLDSPFQYDVLVTPPTASTVGNGSFYNTFEGTCGGGTLPPFDSIAIIYVTAPELASAECASLDPTYYTEPLQPAWPMAEPTWYLCGVAN
jgi:hypothetical protein